MRAAKAKMSSLVSAFAARILQKYQDVDEDLDQHLGLLAVYPFLKNDSAYTIRTNQ